MSGVAIHVCHRTDDDGRPLAPAMVTCGNCGRSWCERCDPCPAALCHYCHGTGHSRAPIPPRQARRISAATNCAVRAAHHSDDLLEVYDGSPRPILLCGYHNMSVGSQRARELLRGKS